MAKKTKVSEAKKKVAKQAMAQVCAVHGGGLELTIVGRAGVADSG